MALSISANQVLKQINIPLLLSVGIHGVFFALILPKLNGNSLLSKNNGLQNTPVIELNQLEQTRLPRQNSANTFNWDIINSLQKENNQTLGLNIPLPTPQISNGGTINLPSLPPLPLPPPPASFYNNPAKIPLPNYPINSSAPSQLPPPANIGAGVNRKIITNLPSVLDSQLSPDNQQITTRIQISPEEEAKIRQRIFANSPIQVTANPRDIINRRKTQRNTEKNTNQNNLINKEAIVKPLPKDYQSLANKLEKNTENTSDEDARKNYVAWSTEVKNAQSKQITLRGSYPKDACIRKLEGMTTYGVTVNPSGSIINTKLIKSSGYTLFNNQALAQIKNHKFANQTGANQPYHVYVNFKYDSKVCPSISINNLGNIPPKTSSPQPVNPNKTNTTPTTSRQKETTLPLETSPKPINQNQINSTSTTPKQKETTLPLEKSPKAVNQNNTNTTPASKPKSTPKLPNSPENKADMLLIPNSSQPVKSRTPTIQPTLPSTSNPPKSLKEESVKPTLPEPNSKSTIQNSEDIKLVK